MVETLRPNVSGPQKSLRFEALLYPHRSLTPSGYTLFFCLFCSFSLVISCYFFFLGAWPIVGFLGIDVLALYWAFRSSYKSAEIQERIQLTAQKLIVKRSRMEGEQQCWVFNPFWVQVLIDRTPAFGGQLCFREKGYDLVIGSFLTSQERYKFANDLNDVLYQQRSGKL